MFAKTIIDIVEPNYFEDQYLKIIISTIKDAYDEYEIIIDVTSLESRLLNQKLDSQLELYTAMINGNARTATYDKVTIDPNKIFSLLDANAFDTLNPATKKALVEEIEKENNKYLSDYKTSLIISEKENFNESSYFELTNIMTEIDDWIWELSDKTDNEYHFDSLAEKDFAKILKKLKTSSWGKNFYPNSKINFEYVLYNKHSSYPDFILKDKNSKIHIFEVKSVNVGYNSIIDEKEYNMKINALKELFLYASLKTSQYFYIPIKKDDNWIIFKYDMGREDILNQDSFVDYFSKLV
jgi:type III restriction enzyme